MRSATSLAGLDDIEVVFDALSHGARRQILLVLQARGDSMTSKEVAGRFSTTWATVSRHLKTLEAAGLVLVDDGDDGRERIFRLNANRLHEVAGGWIANFDQSKNRSTEPNKT